MRGDDQQRLDRGNTAIVVDSCADLPTALRDDPNLTMVPLNVHFGDEVFRDWSSMTVDDIQTFLDHQGCEGDGCLRSGSYAWPGATVTWCDPVPAGTGSFAQMLSIITTGCRINPQVALVMIAKESQELTRPAPDALTGFACPDSGPGGSAAGLAGPAAGTTAGAAPAFCNSTNSKSCSLQFVVPAGGLRGWYISSLMRK